MLRPSSSWWLASALGVSLVAASVEAQPVPPVTLDPAAVATRRALVLEAERARDSGDHERALDLAQRAGRLEMTPSLRWFLAREYQSVGRLAQALGAAQLCVREATQAAALRDRRRIADDCGRLVTSLEGRVGRLVTAAPMPAPDGLRVTVAGSELPPELLGVPYVVTPGEVVVEARAPGFLPYREVVTVAEAGQAAVNLRLEPAPTEPPTVTPPTNPPRETVRVTPPGSRAPREGSPSPRGEERGGARGAGVGPWVLVGVGGAGLVFSLVSFVLREQALSERDLRCDEGGCDEAVRPAHDRAADWTLSADVSLGVGLAAVGAGVLWYLLAPRATVRVTALGGGQGLLVGGAL